jgi:hypothetical protein
VRGAPATCERVGGAARKTFASVEGLRQAAYGAGARHSGLSLRGLLTFVPTGYACMASAG